MDISVDKTIGKEMLLGENVIDKHLIYVVPQKIQKRRRDILLSNSSKKGLNTAEEFRCLIVLSPILSFNDLFILSFMS